MISSLLDLPNSRKSLFIPCLKFGEVYGIALTNAGADAQVASVAIQPDGKILVAGRVTGTNSNSDFALVRYNTDSSLDTGFDVDGKLSTPLGSGIDSAYHVQIQPDGKILVSGLASNGTNYDFAVARYNANGSLDTSFDGDGKLTTSFGAGDDQAWSITLQSDGKIVARGSANGSFAVARYQSNGSLDTSFGNNGKVITNFGSSSYGASLLRPD